MNQRKKENKKKFRKTVKGCDERNKSKRQAKEKCEDGEKDRGSDISQAW